MSRSPSPFLQTGHRTVPSNLEYIIEEESAISSKPPVGTSGRAGEGEEGGGRQNEPRAIISMARQLRSSRGHLLLRARRPDDRSSFNNLPPVPSHRGRPPSPSLTSQLRLRFLLHLRLGPVRRFRDRKAAT